MKRLNKKAFSVVEYAVLFVVIIGAFIIMRPYIQRGSFGMWQQSGQSFAFGRQYDSQKTIECAFDAGKNSWYDRNCVLNQCPNGGTTCIENVITSGNCTSSYCTTLNNQAPQ